MDSYFKSTSTPKGSLSVWVDESPASVVLNNDFFGASNDVTTSVETVLLAYTVNDVVPSIEIVTEVQTVGLGYTLNAVTPTINVTRQLDSVNLEYTVNDVIPSASISTQLTTVNIGYNILDVIPIASATTSVETVSLNYTLYSVRPFNLNDLEQLCFTSGINNLIEFESETENLIRFDYQYFYK